MLVLSNIDEVVLSIDKADKHPTKQFSPTRYAHKPDPSERLRTVRHAPLPERWGTTKLCPNWLNRQMFPCPACL